MANIATKFNVGDEVFIIDQEIDLNEIDYGGSDLLKNILSGVRKLKIQNIILDNNGIKYSGTDRWSETKLYDESQLFVSEKEVVNKLVTDLKNHLITNLSIIEDLIQNLEENYDELRQECSK